MQAAGLATLRGYRQLGVNARLAIGGAALLALALIAALVSLSLGPVDISAGDVAWIVLVRDRVRDGRGSGARSSS